MWEPAHVEIPPLLTMPGVQSSNDLVIKQCKILYLLIIVCTLNVLFT